jgi:hypothetical protein
MPGIGSRSYSKLDQLGSSRLARKLQKKADNDKRWKECVAACNERDEFRCRVCGRYGNPRSRTMLNMIHHHHLIPNERRCGIHEVSRVISLCARCHNEIHVDCTLELTGDANARSVETGRLCGVTVKRHGEGGWKVVKVC